LRPGCIVREIAGTHPNQSVAPNDIADQRIVRPIAAL